MCQLTTVLTLYVVMEWREVNSTGRSEKAFVSGASQLKVEGETDRLIAAPGLVRRDFRLYENRLQGFCTRSSLRHGLVSSLTGRVQCREGFKFKSHFAVDTVLFCYFFPLFWRYLHHIIKKFCVWNSLTYGPGRRFPAQGISRWLTEVKQQGEDDLLLYQTIKLFLY